MEQKRKLLKQTLMCIVLISLMAPSVLADLVDEGDNNWRFDTNDPNPYDSEHSADGGDWVVFESGAGLDVEIGIGDPQAPPAEYDSALKLLTSYDVTLNSNAYIQNLPIDGEEPDGIAVIFVDGGELNLESGSSISGSLAGVGALGEFTLNNEGEITSDWIGLASEESTVTVNNYNLIEGGGLGIEFLGMEEGTSITNHEDGVIEGSVAGIFIENGFVTGALVNVAEGEGEFEWEWIGGIANQGQILGGEYGIEITGNAEAHIINEGLIAGQIGIYGEDSTTTVNIINTENGQITGSDKGVELALGASALVINEGLIEGYLDGVKLQNGSGELTNYGTIRGIEEFNVEVVFDEKLESEVLDFSGGVGMYIENSSYAIYNEETGTITGDGAGIFAWDSLVGIENEGVIRGTADIIEVEFEGQWYDYGGVGVYLQNAAEGTTVTNLEGALIEGGHQGIYVQGGQVDIINEGTIRGTDTGSHGISTSESVVSIGNQQGGLIEGDHAAINSWGTRTWGDFVGIENDGEIIGGVFGVYNRGGEIDIENHADGYIYGGEAGVEIAGAYDGADIVNHGTIAGGLDGIHAGASDLRIDNHGTIEGGAWGVDMNHDLRPERNMPSDRLELNNYGSIVGGGWGVAVGAGTPEINHYDGEIRVTGDVPEFFYEMLEWIESEDPDFELHESFGNAAIYLGGIGDRPANEHDDHLYGTIGGEVNLHADVFGDIVHAGDSEDALLTLNDGLAESAVVDGDIDWGNGTLRQNDGVWSIGNVEAGDVEMIDGELTTGEITAATVDVSGGHMTTAGTLTTVGWTEVSGGTLTVSEMLDAGPQLTVSGGELAANDVSAASVDITSGQMTAGGVLSSSNVDIDGGLLDIDGLLNAATVNVNDGGTLRLVGGAEHGYVTLSMQRGGMIAANGALELDAGNGFDLLDEGSGAYLFDTSLGNIAVSDLTLDWDSTLWVSPDGEELVLRDMDTNGNIVTLDNGVLRLTDVAENGTQIGDNLFASESNTTVIVDSVSDGIGDDAFETNFDGTLAYSSQAAVGQFGGDYDEATNTFTVQDFDFTTGNIATPEDGTLNLTGTTTLADNVPIIGGGTTNVEQFSPFGSAALDFRGGGTVQANELTEDHGGLNLLGTGRFNLGQPDDITDSSGYSGTITLSGSNILALNSNVGGDVFLENAQSQLMGEGAIGGNLTITQGWHRPGNSIGVQTIASDYFIASGATLEIEFDVGQDNCDRLDVLGEANIQDGAILELVDLSGGSVADQTQYTYLTAAGGWAAGTDPNNFDVNPIAFYDIALNYDDNDAWFTVTRGISDPSEIARTANQLAISRAVGAAWDKGELPQLDIAWQQLSESEQSQLLNELSPEPYRAHRLATMGQAQAMASQWTAQSRQARPTYGMVNPIDYIAQAQGSSNSAIDYPDTAARNMAHAGTEQQQWGGFFRPFGQYGEQDSGADRTGFRSRSGGFVAGVDYGSPDDLVQGIGIGYTHTRIDYSQSRGDSKINSLRVGPYLSYNHDDIMIDASLSGAIHWVDSTRRIPQLGLAAESDHRDYDLSAYLGASINIEHDKWTLAPGASLQYTHLWSSSFTETGAGDANLNIYSKNIQSLRSLLGVAATGREDFIFDNTKPTLYAGWGFEMLDDDTTIEGRFAGSQASTFRVDAKGQGRHSAILGAGLNFDLSEGSDGFISYQAEVLSNADFHTLMGGVSWKF